MKKYTDLSYREGSEMPREITPFGNALKLARMIKTREDDVSDLQKVMSELNEGQQEAIVWRVLTYAILERQYTTAALFAAAHIARKVHIAHYGVPLLKLTREGGLSLKDLQALGLLKTGVNEKSKKAFLRPVIGRKAFEEAIKLLQESGDYAAAEILRKPILESDKRKLLREAKKDAERGEQEGKKIQQQIELALTPEKTED